MRHRPRAARERAPSRFARMGLTTILILLILTQMGSAVHAGATRRTLTILAFGDSLTAGHGLPLRKSYPSLLEAALRRDGFQVKLINAGVSGDTTAGGLSRLDWALGDNPAIAVVELGANDGLRGLKPKQTEANLDAILTKLKKRGVLVLLTGMYAPPNMGRAFGRQFNAIFPRLAEKYNVLFYPFFLDGVAGKPALNQGDGLHPNEEGAAIIARRLYPYVRKLIEITRR